MNKILSSKISLRNTKEKLYTCNSCSVEMYACKTWSTMQGDEEKLLTCE